MSSSYRVLLAEDEATFARLLARFLQERGHEVLACSTGKATLAALDQREWDALLLDLKLPDASGVDILERLRREHEELQTIMSPASPTWSRPSAACAWAPSTT